MGFQIANPASRYIHIYIMAPIYLYISINCIPRLPYIRFNVKSNILI